MDIQCEVCIAGGGPAGMMLGLILARAGVDVVVLEKHADFLRDFRGDTVHPSTLDVLDELGLQEFLEEMPHHDVAHLQTSFVDGTHRIADFSRLKVSHPYIRFMPQWDFLNVLAEAAEALPTFRLLRRHVVTDLRREGGVVTGITAVSDAGVVHVAASLSVAADGRASVLRDRSGLVARDFHAPMDVLWFRVSRAPGDEEGLDMHVGAGAMGLAIDRGEYWQIAYLVAKGTDEQIRTHSIDDFRGRVAVLFPSLAPRVSEISNWEDVKTLTVQLNRLRQWHVPGLLCIGDAAHAMSPVGGVGINLAIQDAVAAGRTIIRQLERGPLNSRTLASIQRRRWLPTVATQFGQRMAHRFLIRRVLASVESPRAPAPLRLLGRSPFLQGVCARLVGVGIRPERVGPRRRTTPF